MATTFENVCVVPFAENEEFPKDNGPLCRISISTEQNNCQLSITNGADTKKMTLNTDMELARVGQKCLVIASEANSYLIKFKAVKDMNAAKQIFKSVIKGSAFSQRTDASSAEQYFQFYSYLSQQQNMMQDYVRTSTYQRAMLNNTADFQDKVVLDVGAGSGILSFFAVQAGARKVYAVEASSMVVHCERLVKNNGLDDRITVIYGKIEEVDVPEKVDIIISEPMGYMLVNERMLETFLHAKKWLKPGGKLFPTQGDLHIAPFTDDALYMEQYSKANFWYQPSFHGVDLSGLREDAVDEYFNQPIVDTFDIRICLARSQKHSVDFLTAHEKDLHRMEVPVSFLILESGTVHGLAFWFDVAFFGSQSTVWLSTSPTQPLTHWYQVRCLLNQPIFVKQGQTLAGTVLLQSNSRQSYDVTIELCIPGTNTKSRNTLDLKNPFFRYTGQQPQPPPGTDNTSPSDAYWDETAAVDHAHPNTFGCSSLLNGATGETQVIQPQSGAVQTNLVPLANVAPVNPGSIPAATIVNPQSAAQLALQTRTSIGAGISPNLFSQSPATVSHNYPISNQFMIGDYVIPGNNMVLPTQGLNFK